MRHALAPGGGDPADFDPDDCATQRNLSDAGRDPARRIGAALRDRLSAASRTNAAAVSMEAFTSVWCRCRESAELLGFGEVQPFAAL